jgi:hypothetical protein
VLLAACAPQPNANGPGTGSVGDADNTIAGATAGMLVISDGSSKVLVGSRTYTFPTTVTDASLSPDGSRIVFIDGDGNVATAHLNGKGVVVLTKPSTGAVRSRPAWNGSRIIFSEKAGGSPAMLREVPTGGSGWAGYYYDGNTLHYSRQQGVAPAELGIDDARGDGDTTGTSPSSSVYSEAQRTVLAFERSGEVWLSDVNGREPYQSKIAAGTEPALSPDETKLAYVVNGQIYVKDMTYDNTPAVQVTFDAQSPTHLVFSPDASKITYSTASDVETVSAAVSPGATSNPATVAYPHPGVATYLGNGGDTVTTVKGADPIEAAIVASHVRWPDNPEGTEAQGNHWAEAVLLAGTDDAPLMLAGAQMVDSGPLLLTGGSALDPRTAAEIKRIFGQPQPDSLFTVTIIGGTGSVSSSVDSAIKKLGYKVKRVSGTDPVSMSITVNDKPKNAQIVLVADSQDTASYVSAISDLGLNSNQTVLMTSGSSLPASVRSYLNAVAPGIPIYGVGKAAQAALASWSTTRWQPVGEGSSSATSKLLSLYGGLTRTLVLVPANDSGQILAAIGLARAYAAPVLVVGSDGVDSATLAWAEANSGAIDNVMVVDGSGSLSSDVVNKVVAAVSGPLGARTVSNPQAAN